MVFFVAAGIATLWAIGYAICYGVVYSEFDIDNFFITSILHITVVAAVISYQLVRLICDPEGMGYKYLGERAEVGLGTGILMWLGLFTIMLVVISVFLKVVAGVEGAKEKGSCIFAAALTIYMSVFTALLILHPGVLGYEKIPKEEQQAVEEVSIDSADSVDEGR